MERPTALVIDDERLIRWSITAELEERGFEVVEADSGQRAREAMAHAPDVVILDFGLPDVQGWSLLEEVRQRMPSTPVILLVEGGEEPRGTEALARGAFHFLAKPFQPAEVGEAAEQARHRAGHGASEPRGGNGHAGAGRGAEGLVGRSDAIARVRTLLAQVAVGPARTVLLSGESGTGRHLAARLLHEFSDRAHRPLRHLTANRASPDTLRAALEACAGGTLIVDGIVNAAMGVQEALLDCASGASEARLIVVGDGNLPIWVAGGALKRELVELLEALRINLPPLRQRLEDVPELAGHFVRVLGPALGSRVTEISPGALERLQTYPWPGNVRELRDTIERALVLCDRPALDERDFDGLEADVDAASTVRLPPQGLDLKELERNLVIQALERTGGNRTRAAELLRMTRDQMRYRVAKFGLADE